MPEQALQLRVHPRGFLGVAGGTHFKAAGGRLALPPDLEAMRRVYRSGEMLENGHSIEPNEQVNQLYTRYIREGVAFGTFAFRKQVLQTALAAFGTRSFDQWFMAQYQCPACGALHGDFLADTLKYIQEGRRNMSLENWAALLQLNPGGGIGKMPSEVQQFFGFDEVGQRRYPNNGADLVDVLQGWLSQPNGLEDLIGTLHILFGSVNV